MEISQKKPSSQVINVFINTSPLKLLEKDPLQIVINSLFCSMQVWKSYVCQVSSDGICVTTGRLTPNFYEQMAAGVNVSYGLYHYGPFLVELQDCTFVRETFIVIHSEHCPGLRRYSKWVYSGLVMVSTAVMLSLVFWIIYGRERRHRVYTKAIRARDFDKGT